MTEGIVANTRMKPLCTSLVVAFTLAIGLVAGPSGEAQNEPPEAREIARLLGTSGEFEAAMRAEGHTAAQAIQARFETRLRRPLSADEAGRLEALLIRLMMETAGKIDFEGFYASRLAQFFSSQELVELAAFYHSPLGAKALRFATIVASENKAEGARLAKTHAREFGERFNAEFSREFPSLAHELQHPQQPAK